MRTRDLFAGYHVQMQPQSDVWLVSLVADDQHTVTMKAYDELPDALDAVHEWALMLSDETEISPDAEAAGDTFRVILAWMAIGEEAHLPETVEEVRQRDELQTWFEREMGNSRDDDDR
ncbi:MAG TPA: hypothetical protein VF221_18735 [Chloroflexota bacterium]